MSDYQVINPIDIDKELWQVHEIEDHYGDPK